MICFIGQNWLYIIFTLLASYLLGSVSFSIIITKQTADKADIRGMGSGNAGFTNVLRSVGKLPAVLTLAGDCLKGAFAVELGKFVFYCLNLHFYLKSSELSSDYLVQFGGYLSGFFCTIGHIYPCFFKFKGGKGIATAAAALLFIDWRIFLVVISVFLITFFISKIVSLASILAVTVYPIAVFFVMCLTGYTIINNILITGMVIMLSAIIIYKHKENIKRIINGQEKQIKSAKK